jgi:peptidoglycan/xylan/chitin deacetylase (PgdA/CDA1 family)
MTAGWQAVTRGLLKAGAAAFDRVRPPASGLVILEYHRVGRQSERELDLDAGLFRDQMSWLGHDRSALSLDDGLATLSTPDGPRATVVTFDDGTADFMDHALPALVSNQIPATYYVATQFIDEQRSFPYGGTPLSWAALAEAVGTGLVTVASHTHSHAVLDKVDGPAAADELKRSAQLIEDNLGTPANHFAYPKGVFGGETIEQLVMGQYASAALVNGCSNPYGASNRYRLNRSPIQQADGMRYFECKVRGGLRAEGSLRNSVNRLRYREAAH